MSDVTKPDVAVNAEAQEYGAMAKFLHWLIVGLLIAQFAVAWIMPDVHRDTVPDTLIDMHLSIGAVILLLAVIRLFWRLANPVAPLIDGLPLWQRRAAPITHGLLYVLLFVVPLVGWINASARGWTIDLFGVFSLPHIVAKGSALGREIGSVHAFVSYTLLALIGLHVAAALYHHFVLRDRVLKRMLPGRG